MKTGRLGGMPGVPGVTALEPVAEGPPIHCGAASMEGKPRCTSNSVTCLKYENTVLCQKTPQKQGQALAVCDP